MQRILLTVTLIIALAAVSNASRRYVPMGDYIEGAELIVIADVHASELSEASMTVKSVLKGDKGYKGKTIDLEKKGMWISSGEVSLPEKKHIAVLFEHQWRQSDMRFLPIVEVYEEKEEIQALKKLTKLKRISSEEKRIKKLIQWFPGAHHEIQQELFETLEHRKEADSFEWFYPAFEVMEDEDHRYKLMRLVEESNDPRAVPFFIELLSHQEQEVRSDAAHALYYQYEGHEGIAEAFEKHWDDKTIREYTRPYLAARYQHPKYQETESKTTPWHQATALQKAGQFDAAHAIYLEYIKDTKHYGSRFYYADQIQQGMSEQTKALLAQYFLDQLPDLKRYEGDTGLKLMGLIQRVDWPAERVAPALLKLLKNEFSDSKVYPHLLILIKQQGEAVRLQAMDVLKAQLNKSIHHALYPFLGVAFLATDDEYVKLMPAGKNRHQNHWSKASTFRQIMKSKDPVEELIEFIHLLGSSNLVGWPEWLLVHLNAHEDTRITPALVKYWMDRQHYGSMDIMKDLLRNAKDDRLNTLLIEALPQVKQPWALYEVTQLIIQRMEADALPQLRQIIKKQMNGHRSLALSALGRYGSAEDVALLNGHCDLKDFKIKQSNVACDALRALKKRHGQDAQGKIIKSNKLTPLDDN